MKSKLRNASRLHPRDPRSRRHGEWQKSVSEGMTRAKRKRQEVGLLTLAQVAAQTCLPLKTIKTMVSEGKLRSIGAGSRRFVFASEIKKLMDAA